MPFGELVNHVPRKLVPHNLCRAPQLRGEGVAGRHPCPARRRLCPLAEASRDGP